MPFFFNDDMQEVLARLARIERGMSRLTRASHLEAERDQMAQADIDKLKAEVQKNTSVSQSAVTLITGLAQQIRDAADDPAELQAIASELEASASALGAAVASNTPSQA